MQEVLFYSLSLKKDVHEELYRGGDHHGVVHLVLLNDQQVSRIRQLLLSFLFADAGAAVRILVSYWSTQITATAYYIHIGGGRHVAKQHNVAVRHAPLLLGAKVASRS